MAEADLFAVHHWLSLHPGPALDEEAVPGASSAERARLATLGRLAGALLEPFASSTGFFATYPYGREPFQSSTATIQIDPMVLGMLLADSRNPEV